MIRAHVARPARTCLHILALAIFVWFVSSLSVPAASAADDPDPSSQVRAAEMAFATTMAERDHAAFTSFLSEEAVFFGGQAVRRGRAEVAAAWKRFFEGEAAPFSWTPAVVEVLASGTLGLSSGPVYDPEGAQIGIFTSIWRLEPDGKWRIIFDKGCAYCEAATGQGAASKEQ